MKYNTQEVAALQPDYLGFIFWEPSKRFFDGEIPVLAKAIKKVGVFVDASLEEVLQKIETYDLWGVQLHGQESQAYCKSLQDKLELIGATTKIIKVFSIKSDFDFSQLNKFEEVCDYYLFDTKGKLPGGNGYMFNWEVLKDYPSAKPYFLSGGIGPDELKSIKAFQNRPEAKYCQVVDVNSKFELEPGLKNIEQLEKFREELRVRS